LFLRFRILRERDKSDRRPPGDVAEGFGL